MKVLVVQQGAGTTAVTLMADSALLRTGRAMYLPEFAHTMVAAPAVIARIDRLGKHIAPRFARRYWKEVTTGFSDGVNVEIIEGLSEGDVVLIESKVSES